LRLVALAEEVRGVGLSCPVVAFGGTPVVDALVPGVTELGAGAYALGDAGLAALGVMPLDRVAISVADAALLDGCGQPWHPEPGARRGDRLVPAHVCPLVLRVPELRTTEGGRWRVLNQADAFGRDGR
jgi:D-serine deaminase-like pyridoxal phosphate-dependent protein